MIQNDNSRLALVGITESCDTVQLMEKRIVSRFSRLQLFIPRMPFDIFIQILKQTLSLPNRNGFEIKFSRNFNLLFDKRNTEIYKLLERRYKLGYSLNIFFLYLCKNS